MLALSSLILVESASAQSMPKPSVPEFTVKLADHSYDVPPSTTTTTDPYTGKQTVTTQHGYHVENKTIDITIKNQPFVPPDNLTNLYYDVRVKGHFGENWTELYSYSVDGGNGLRLQSASENTVISTPQDYPADGQVDFQVEAVIATIHPLCNTNFAYWEYETSGWSNTQTITIAANAAKLSGNLTTSTSDQSGNSNAPQIDFYGITVAALVIMTVIAVLAIGIILIRRKNR
jgi:hypothetical protein